MRIHKGVSGGTPTGEPLCNSCSNFGYRRGARESQEILLCGGIKLAYKMYECSSYEDKRLVTPMSFYDGAWIILDNKTIVPSKEHNKLVDEGREAWVNLQTPWVKP